MEHKLTQGDTLTRLALCAAVAVGAISLCEKLLPGGQAPLWEKYGPWVRENPVQAIALATAALYVLSLVLWPGEAAAGEEGFTPCV